MSAPARNDAPAGKGRLRAFARRTAAALALAYLAAAAAPAQDVYADRPFNPAQIDQLVAPIALYPDALLSQVLMAATYPLEVVEAARWVRDPRYSGLRGEALTAVLEQIDWDPSVKALVPFPQVLMMMESRLAWMQQLGDAFLAQEADVMNAVQRLRHSALAAGYLTSTPEQVVRLDGNLVYIESANPGLVYVPYYDPSVVYGAWPYPAYPPVLLVRPPGFAFRAAIVPGFFFSAGLYVLPTFWGWTFWDWHHHSLHIDVRRFNAINRHRPPRYENVWRHDPYHRRGVTYRDPRTQRHYAPQRVAPRPAAPQFRGYPSREAPRAVAPSRSTAPRTTTRTAPRTTTRAAPAPRAPAPPTRTRPVEPRAQRAPAPAFEGIGRGAEVRREVERGRTSREQASRAPRRASPTRSAPRTTAPRRTTSPPAETRPKNYRPQELMK